MATDWTQEHRLKRLMLFRVVMITTLLLIGQALARQIALEQEEGDLFVGRLLGEVGDVVAAVHEDAALRIDRADGRLGDDDT